MNDETPTGEEPSPSWMDKLSGIFSQDPKNRSELLSILNEAGSRGIIDTEALSIIEGAVQVADMQVREIMIPRSQMVCVDEDQEPRDFLPKIIESAHSRFPVIGDTKDEIIGILLAKDLLPLILQNNRFNIKDHLRPATFIPESKRLNVLLKEFRTNRNHMAIVIDEFGGVAGLVTIEDVLEQIVGDIEDEHDVEEDSFIKPVEENANTFIVKALTPIEDFNEHFNAKFSDEEFDTIGGIVMQEFGHMPKRNEYVEISGFRFDVLNSDGRRIRLLRVTDTHQ
ncbi:magnesium transporter [Endozoicomonas montiporae]|uniref:Magnesium and cobalt efflux protein CorC n=2 Tax=Endozoicomonas montiporae TaxID=1027273 RepID=A0A081N3K9_9GAMM|nr:transporter associated domain-containing protein [Endozoicomonas montiporae]AMO58340.1 magnesium and cobalt transporter [Endozoicomonas montiporae CL-33]KEQ13032.1 magnesium transporter [Endozoicomonas montiporae]